jgi:hypothetical protein
MQDLQHLSNPRWWEMRLPAEFKRSAQRNGESLLALIFLEQLQVLIRNFALWEYETHDPLCTARSKATRQQQRGDQAIAAAALK